MLFSADNNVTKQCRDLLDFDIGHRPQFDVWIRQQIADGLQSNYTNTTITIDKILFLLHFSFQLWLIQYGKPSSRFRVFTKRSVDYTTDYPTIVHATGNNLAFSFHPCVLFIIHNSHIFPLFIHSSNHLSVHSTVILFILQNPSRQRSSSRTQKRRSPHWNPPQRRPIPQCQTQQRPGGR